MIKLVNEKLPSKKDSLNSFIENGTPKLRRVTSDELLAGQNELVILHGGEEYRLRKTSKGKLILTK